MNTKRTEQQTETCDHCKQRVASGTCHGTSNGIEWWCDRCLDADEALWEAEYQARKDRAREPDRWPTGARG